MMVEWRDRKRFVEVHGRRMAWVEEGAGAPVVLLHGNPSSSFLWRDVMAAMRGAGRLLAPDLIGMGDSDKLPESGPGRYTLAEHARYLDAWFDAVVPEGPAALVVHDWGGPLGFRWARMTARASALAYMETIIRPMTFEEWPAAIRGLFQALRGAPGESMILEKNVFVERILPGSILRRLTEEEMAEYRRPFAAPGEGRRPTLSWPRQIPLEGEPADAVETVAQNWAWLRASDIPKLLIEAEPGAIMTGAVLESARKLPNQRETTVRGSHFLQEDSGAEIGRAIAGWLADVGARGGPAGD
jgi:haloalkane dehalogenase